VRRSILGAAALGAALLLAAGAAAWRVGGAVDVPVVVAAEGRVAQHVTGPGTVQARIPVTLSARITAIVGAVQADVGDSVRRGQVLVLLDDRDLAARRGVVDGQRLALARQVEAAQAALAKARTELELAQARQRRDDELLGAGFVSPAALDASNAGLKAAAAGLDNAHSALKAREADTQALAHEALYADAMLSHTRLTAPMDGIVIARQVEAGATVVPGSTLLRLVDPATLWVATRVDESVVSRIEPGQRAQIRLRSGERLAGRVARIARQSDAATRELDVHVAFDVPPARFAIDQEAEVEIDVGAASGIVVPLSALTRDDQGRQGVLVIDGARARFQPVSTGVSDGAQVLVASGLAAGARLVAQAQGVRPGARVNAAEPAGAAGL
jgi:HlyD family secretion protein